MKVKIIKPYFATRNNVSIDLNGTIQDTLKCGNTYLIVYDPALDYSYVCLDQTYVEEVKDLPESTSHPKTTEAVTSIKDMLGQDIKTLTVEFK